MQSQGVTFGKVVVFLICSAGLFFLLTAGNRGSNPSDTPDPRYLDRGRLDRFDEPLPLKFDKTVLAFGEVQGGQMLDFDFVFTNPTGKPIEGLRAQPSCGCTIANIDPRDVAPGQRGRIGGVLHTQGFSGFIEKTIDVTSANTDGLTRLSVKAVVIPTIKITPKPEAVTFDEVPEGQGAEATVTLVNDGTTIPAVKDIRASDPDHITVEDAAPFYTRNRPLQIRLKPGLKPGVHESVITVYYEDRVLPFVSIPVKTIVTAAKIKPS